MFLAKSFFKAFLVNRLILHFIFVRFIGDVFGIVLSLVLFKQVVIHIDCYGVLNQFVDGKLAAKKAKTAEAK